MSQTPPAKTSRKQVLDRLDAIARKLRSATPLSATDRQFISARLKAIRECLPLLDNGDNAPCEASAELAFIATTRFQIGAPDLAWEIQVLDLELAELCLEEVS
jgi:hypothetical protein